MNPSPVSFESLVADYRNTAEQNDEVHARMTTATWANPVLAEHRRHIEAGKLGFGDPAFHAMWQALLEAASRKFTRVRALEIGVFKGQVISLWALLAQRLSLPVEISAVSPLKGQSPPPLNLWTKIRYRLDRRFRDAVDNGNFYEEADYEAIVRALFTRFGADFATVKLQRGFSNDPSLLARLSDARYEIIYVDGDHTYEGARRDFENFGPKVVPGGWLVADDAGCDLPGSSFWKGHPSVTRATAVLAGLGFKNVLNVGHNRIYERTNA